MARIKYLSQSAEETMHIGKALAKQCSHPKILCLSGDLGSGKTTLIKGMVGELTGINPDEILSPTFTTYQVYEAKNPVVHFDLYRLRSPEEFCFLGLEEYLDGSMHALIEWPEKIASLLPKHCMHIQINYLTETVREIHVYENTI